MPMSPRLLRPRASGPTHPEARDWVSRVVANGGTVSSSTGKAVDQFCRDIDATSGLRAAILRLNLFCGNNLNACLVPLYRAASLTASVLGNTTDTNNNFVSGDFQETGSGGGLKGNGSTKYLNTGFSTSLFASQTNVHLSASGTSFDGTGGGNQTFIGSDVGTGSQVCSLDENLDYLGDVRAFRSGSGFPVGSVASTTNAASESHFIGTRTSSTASRLYRGGSQVTLNTASLTPTSSTQAFFVFAIPSSGSPVSYSSGRFRMYSIGNGLTAAQALAFSNAVIAFNTTLGRA